MRAEAAAAANLQDSTLRPERINNEGAISRLPFRWPKHSIWRCLYYWRVRALCRWRARNARRVIHRSTLFNASWYLARYPDVQSAAIDPIEHYILHGATELRDPGPEFSTLRYLTANPDVLVSGVNPLAHYENHGRAEGRQIVSVDASGPPRRALRIVYISGEMGTPGHTFRVARYADTARALGCEATVLPRNVVAQHLDAIRACNLLVIWRTPWDPEMAEAVAAARASGARIQFDVDDLMFEPELARVEIIDGIRSQGFTEPATEALYRSVAEMVRACDLASAPTPYLAERLTRLGPISFILPNGFDAAVWQSARRAVRARALAPPDDDLIRIGYAAGTRTHQRDFAQAAEAVAAVLAARPQARLVLFRDGATPMVELGEYPEFDSLADQIEWREMVPVDKVVHETARYDIKIAPLECDNVFCESKSELKFFEAGLVEVPLVASPTGPFASAIEHGQTGLLAHDTASWQEALLSLVDEKALRLRLGRAGYYAVLWRYSAEARRAHLRAMLAQIFAEPSAAAQAFALERFQKAQGAAPAPRLPPHQTEILHDRLDDARVTIVIVLGDNVEAALETLECARLQTMITLDLVVLDDQSNAQCRRAARAWIARHGSRFNRLALLSSEATLGFGLWRNAGFANAETPYVLPLASGRLLPRAFAEQGADLADRYGAAFVGGPDFLPGHGPYPLNVLRGGGPESTALIRLAAWVAVGGYLDTGPGEEDSRLWDRFAARSLFGVSWPALDRALHGVELP